MNSEKKIVTTVGLTGHLVSAVAIPVAYVWANGKVVDSNGFEVTDLPVGTILYRLDSLPKD